MARFVESNSGYVTVAIHNNGFSRSGLIDYVNLDDELLLKLTHAEAASLFKALSLVVQETTPVDGSMQVP